MVAQIHRTRHVESLTPTGGRDHRVGIMAFLADKFDKKLSRPKFGK